MSFKRTQRDHQKVNNYVAHHDFNKGGFHEKSTKQTRANEKSELSRIGLDTHQLNDEIEYEHIG